MILCAGFGYGTYRITSDLEYQVYETQYNSIASIAYDSIVNGAVEKVKGVRVMSTVLSQQFPSNATWPNVTWRGYDETVQPTILQRAYAIYTTPTRPNPCRILRT